MSITSLLTRGQKRWAVTATDTCRITRLAVSGDATYVAQVINETTAQYPTQGRVTIYQGPCRIQVKVDINSNIVETVAGDRKAVYYVGQLQLPVITPTGATGSVDDIDINHVAEILTSPNAPSLPGSKFNIQGSLGHKSHPTYNRWRVREVAA